MEVTLLPMVTLIRLEQPEKAPSTIEVTVSGMFMLVSPPGARIRVSMLLSKRTPFKLLYVALSESTFISRGDNSGTHIREKSIWEAAGIEPSGEWYKSAGQGMGTVLIMANEQQAYTLTDTGTYYSMIDKLNIPILFSGDAHLDNVYSVLPLNSEKHPDLKHAEVKQFIEWLTSEKTLEKIGAFEVNGHMLFKVVDNPDYVETPPA